MSAVTRKEPITPPVALIAPVLVFSAAITFQAPTFGGFAASAPAANDRQVAAARATTSNTTLLDERTDTDREPTRPSTYFSASAGGPTPYRRRPRPDGQADATAQSNSTAKSGLPATQASRSRGRVTDAAQTIDQLRHDSPTLGLVDDLRGAGGQVGLDAVLQVKREGGFGLEVRRPAAPPG